MSTTETLTWYATSERMPDDDRVVPISAPAHDDRIVVGWWDGSSWKYGDSWPLDEAQVAYWAEMPRWPR